VTDTRISPKKAWSYLNPNAGFEPVAGVAVGAVVGGGRPVQGDGYVRGHIEPVVGYRQVRSQLEIGQWPEFE
jgi:hypothetical protein